MNQKSTEAPFKLEELEHKVNSEFFFAYIGEDARIQTKQDMIDCGYTEEDINKEIERLLYNKGIFNEITKKISDFEYDTNLLGFLSNATYRSGVELSSGNYIFVLESMQLIECQDPILKGKAGMISDKGVEEKKPTILCLGEVLPYKERKEVKFI